MDRQKRREASLPPAEGGYDLGTRREAGCLDVRRQETEPRKAAGISGREAGREGFGDARHGMDVMMPVDMVGRAADGRHQGTPGALTRRVTPEAGAMSGYGIAPFPFRAAP